LRAVFDGISAPVLAVAAAVVLAAVAAVLIVRAPTATDSPNLAALPPGNGMPVLAVEPLEVSGMPGALWPHALQEKIRDAFSRFDTVNLIVDPEKGRTTDYRLAGAIDYRSNSNASVRFRLIDTTTGKIVWSQSYDVPPGGEKAAEDEIVTALATSLLQSYGVIRSLDRAKHLASKTGDPRYRCVLQAAEAFRSQEQAQYVRARACLEQLTARDPSFAVGFSFLSVLYTREYYVGTGAAAEDAALLDQALRAARRGVELNPASSRAHVMLLVVLYARREVSEAFAAADKATAINPYDMLTFAEYGGRLIMSGEIERGMVMLRRAAGYGSVLPSWHHFYMFLGAYLGGDMRTAAYHAGQITAEGYPNGHLAKALAAAAAGDTERARQETERLFELRPSWRSDPSADLGKFILQPDLLDRLVRDLAAARLGGRS
jgi:tetratricopeptide (TPR) repeat protein